MDIIFDIGNVICRWDGDRLTASIFRDHASQRLVREQVIGHSDWLDLDRGSMKLEHAAERAAARTGIARSKIMELYRETGPSLIPFKESVDLIQELYNHGHRLFILSNMHQHVWNYLESTYNFWSCFTGIVISSQVGSIKPERAIYQHLLKRWSIVPQEAVFLDDLPENLKAAREFSLNTIEVSSPSIMPRKIMEISASGVSTHRPR